jgi:hypothetical protein
VDNYGHYIPGFCGGLSLGNIRDLKELLEEGIDLNEYPIFKFILQNDFKSFYKFSCQKGYSGKNMNYYSKCHLCVDMRKFLVAQEDFRELQPRQFYHHLDE